MTYIYTDKNVLQNLLQCLLNQKPNTRKECSAPQVYKDNIPQLVVSRLNKLKILLSAIYYFYLPKLEKDYISKIGTCIFFIPFQWITVPVKHDCFFPSLSSRPFNVGTSQFMTRQTNIPLGAQLLHPQKGTVKAVFQTTVLWKPDVRQLILFHKQTINF